jgi:hypothetical protein
VNASIVAAICATVIAVLSLAVSVYKARSARRHDRICVRPHLALPCGTAPAGLSQSATALTGDRTPVPDAQSRRYLKWPLSVYDVTNEGYFVRYSSCRSRVI